MALKWIVVPDNMKNLKLKDLIRKAESHEEFEWLCSLDLSSAMDVTPAVMEPLSRDSVERIYSRRSRLNSKINAPINGFEYLLSKLAATSVETVKIHAVLKSGKKYFVFTDTELNELLGILGPLRTAQK